MKPKTQRAVKHNESKRSQIKTEEQESEDRSEVRGHSRMSPRRAKREELQEIEIINKNKNVYKIL